MQARDVALFSLLYGCGLRISEALALDVGAAPLPGRGRGAAGGGQGRKGTDRAGAAGGARGDGGLAAPSPLAHARGAAVHRRARGAAEPGGGAADDARLPPAQRPARARHAARAAALLRHPPAGRRAPTCASIQDLLGHASLSTTQRYTSVDEAGLLEVWRRTHPRVMGAPQSGSSSRPRAAVGQLAAFGVAARRACRHDRRHGALQPQQVPLGDPALDVLPHRAAAVRRAPAAAAGPASHRPVQKSRSRSWQAARSASPGGAAAAARSEMCGCRPRQHGLRRAALQPQPLGQLLGIAAGLDHRGARNRR